MVLTERRRLTGYRSVVWLHSTSARPTPAPLMGESLIRAANGSGWIPVEQARLHGVFIPREVGAAPCQGWSEVRFAVAGVEVSVSGEQVGWQIVFEGELDPVNADAFVEKISNQLSEESGQPVTWSILAE